MLLSFVDRLQCSLCFSASPHYKPRGCRCASVKKSDGFWFREGLQFGETKGKCQWNSSNRHTCFLSTYFLPTFSMLPGFDSVSIVVSQMSISIQLLERLPDQQEAHLGGSTTLSSDVKKTQLCLSFYLSRPTLWALENRWFQHPVSSHALTWCFELVGCVSFNTKAMRAYSFFTGLLSNGGGSYCFLWTLGQEHI